MVRKDSKFDKMTDEEFEKMYDPRLPPAPAPIIFTDKVLSNLICLGISTSLLFFLSLLLLIMPPHSGGSLGFGCIFGMFFMMGFLAFFLKLCTAIWGIHEV